jgi:predicted transcriptional regulator YheO
MSAMKITENQLLLREGKKIVDALGKTFFPLVEVVLHDLTVDEHHVVAISNNLSGRSIGASTTEIGLARISDPNFPEVLQSYPNQFPDGRPAKSTSIGIKNSAGDYVMAICLNIDVSLLSAAASSLQQLVQTESPTVDIKENLVSPSLDVIRSTLEHYATSLNTTPRMLTPAHRRAAIQQLSQAGLMDLKNAQRIVANTLGIARSTVYTYLPQKGGAA